MNDLLIKNGLVFLKGNWVKTNLAVLGEKISYIGNDEATSKEVLDAEGLKVLPGLIDPHVHFELNCGRVTSCDDFYTGSVCAAYGGVTTIIDFLDPTRNAEELEKSYYERIALAKKSLVDYHMHACIREPNGDLEEYVKTVVKLGMRTIKLFTTYSDTHRRTYDKDILELLRLSKKYNIMIEAHIENDDLIDLRDEYTYKDLPVSRPSLSETSEALKLAKIVRETGGNFYMVHCSSGETLKALKEQFSDILGKNFFVESCPQSRTSSGQQQRRASGDLRHYRTSRFGLYLYQRCSRSSGERRRYGHHHGLRPPHARRGKNLQARDRFPSK